MENHEVQLQVVADQDAEEVLEGVTLHPLSVQTYPFSRNK